MLIGKTTLVATPAVSTALTTLTSIILSMVGTTTPVLMSGLIGAMVALYFQRTSEKIWLVVVGILSRGIVGAWMSEILPHFSLTAFTGKVKQEALAGICAVLIQVVYHFVVKYGDAMVVARRRGNGGGA